MHSTTCGVNIICWPHLTSLFILSINVHLFRKYNNQYLSYSVLYYHILALYYFNSLHIVLIFIVCNYCIFIYILSGIIKCRPFLYCSLFCKYTRHIVNFYTVHCSVNTPTIVNFTPHYQVVFVNTYVYSTRSCLPDCFVF